MFLPLEKLAQAVKNINIVKIYLDPGHGGKDSGGVGYSLKEKDVVLDITLKAAEVFEKGNI